MLNLPIEIIDLILSKTIMITRLDPLFMCVRYLVCISLVNRLLQSLSLPLWGHLDRCYARDRDRRIPWKTQRRIFTAFGHSEWDQVDISLLEASKSLRVKIGAIIQQNERMCKSKALSNYRLKQSDIEHLAAERVPNPHHVGSAPMSLYSIQDIVRVAQDKWTTQTNLDIYISKQEKAKEKRAATKRAKASQSVF